MLYIRAMAPTHKRGRGRPSVYPTAMLEPITIRLPKDMVEQLAAIRSKRMDAPDKASLIRELLARAIKMELGAR